MQWLRAVRSGGKLYCKPTSTTDCSAREEEKLKIKLYEMGEKYLAHFKLTEVF
jgi:hypothetical protein